MTNNIRENVIYSKEEGWKEIELSNIEICEKLNKEYKDGYFSFGIGLYCTAYARYNLLNSLLKLDEYLIYADTDSLKLKEGFDKKIIENYNKSVIEKLQKVSSERGIDFNRFQPKDKNGNRHMLGLFELDDFYLEFKTLGAKKYCYTKEVKNEKIKATYNVIKKGKEKSKVLGITVSGVPKKGSKCLNLIEDFKEKLVFESEITNKKMLLYNDEQPVFMLTDYTGKTAKISEKHGVCMLPATYTLDISENYADLIYNDTSKRAIYKEEKNDK